MENIEESCPLRITPTVRALSSALRGKSDVVSANGGRLFPEPDKLWFKESSAKNLRTRDFLSPTTMLNTLYADGQVCGWQGRPSGVLSRLRVYGYVCLGSRNANYTKDCLRSGTAQYHCFWHARCSLQLTEVVLGDFRAGVHQLIRPKAQIRYYFMPPRCFKKTDPVSCFVRGPPWTNCPHLYRPDTSSPWRLLFTHEWRELQYGSDVHAGLQVRVVVAVLCALLCGQKTQQSTAKRGPRYKDLKGSLSYA